MCGFVCRKLGFAIGGNMMTRKQNKLEERNALVDTVGRVPIKKINFCSSVLRLSKLPRCRERPQTAIC